MQIIYNQSIGNTHIYELTLHPSSCDFTQNYLQRSLQLNELVTGSIEPFSFQVTKTNPSRYHIFFTHFGSIVRESMMNAQFGILNDTFNIPQTFIASPFLQSLEEGLTTAQAIVSAVAGGRLVGTLALGSTSALWSLINFQQFVGYFLFLNVGYPFQVELFLSLIQFSLWDILPNPLSSLTESLSTQVLGDVNSKDENAPPKKFAKNNITSFFIENGGTIILTNLFLLVILAVVLALKKTTKLKDNKILKKLKVNLRWNLIIRTFLENGVPLSLATFLQLRVLEFNGVYFSLNAFLTITSLIYLCIMILFLIQILSSRSNQHLKLGLVKRIFGSLHEGVTLTNSLSKYYYIIVLLRGMFLIFVVCILDDYPIFQIVSLIFFNACFLHYLLKEVQFESSRLNIVVKFKETMIFLGEITILFLHVQTYNKEYYEIVGWLVVSLLGLAFLVEFVYIIGIQIFGIKELIKQIKKLKNKICAFIKNCLKRKDNKVHNSFHSTQNNSTMESFQKTIAQ